MKSDRRLLRIRGSVGFLTDSNSAPVEMHSVLTALFGVTVLHLCESLTC